MTLVSLLLMGCGEKSAEIPVGESAAPATETAGSGGADSPSGSESGGSPSDSEGSNPKEEDSSPPPNPELQMSFVLGIHTGEGICSLENESDVSNPDYVTCREGLYEVAQGLEEMGVHAEFQFHGGFLELLVQDGVDLEREITQRGHGLGTHLHTQCLESLDPTTICQTRDPERWGRTGGDQEPDLPTLSLRASSGVRSLSDLGWTPSSFNFWGSSYRLASEAEQGVFDSANMLSELDLVVALVADTPRDIPDGEGGLCFDGRRDDKSGDDVFRSQVHAVRYPNETGEKSIVALNIATTKWGISNYDQELVYMGLRESIECMAGRVANPEVSGWAGEPFVYAGLTHLHNMIEDNDGDGRADGLLDLSLFIDEGKQIMAEHSTKDHVFTMSWLRAEEMLELLSLAQP